MASDMTQETANPPPQRGIGAAAYVVAGLSFIPLVGVLLGLIGLIWAAVSRRSGRLIVAIVSLCGIGVTVGIYSWLFYQTTNPDGPYAPLSAKLSQTLLVENVKAIELYKLKTGSYPATLAEVQARFPDAGMVAVADPSAAFRSTGSDFYYARISDSSYDLRGVGPDGRALTEDDVFPDLGIGPRGQIGLVSPRTGAGG